MILQLFPFLNMSFDEHVGIWSHSFDRKNFLNQVENWRRSQMYQLKQKPPKLDKKIRRKTRDLINK